MAIKIAITEPVIFTGNPPGVDPSHDLRASDKPNLPALYILDPGTPTGSRLIATWYTPIDTVINIKGFAKINPQLVPDPNDPTDVNVQLGLAADKSQVYNVTMRIRIYVLYDDTGLPTPAPGLLVQPNALNFTTIQGTNPAPQTFTITNTGNAPLNWVITKDANATTYIPITPAQSTLAPGQSTAITVAPNVAQANAGTINALITVSDSDAGTTVPSQTVTVTIVINTPPALSVTPTSLIGSQGCLSSGGNFICLATLTNTSQTLNLLWTVTTNLLPGSSIIPTNGTLSPGQSIRVQIVIPLNDCAPGASITFSGPGNSVTVPWIC